MAYYYILYQNREVGPMSLEQLKGYNLTPNSMIRVDNGPWIEAFNRPEVMSMITSQVGPATSNDQQHLIAGLLAVLVGFLGIQYFYIGKNKAGVITILLSIVTCGIWEIITFIQGILMIMMTQQEFERKYVYTTSSFPVF